MAFVGSTQRLSCNDLDNRPSRKTKTFMFVADQADSICQIDTEDSDGRNTLQTRNSIIPCSLDDLNEVDDSEVDNPAVTTYEVNSIILMGEEEYENPSGNFTCYMNNETKQFFIEVSTEETLRGFTKSTFLNMLRLAQASKAEDVFICVDNSVSNKDRYCKDLLFVGCSKLSTSERKKLMVPPMYTVLRFPIDDSQDDEDLDIL